ncbi:MAG: hypothetical protein CMH63_01645 [Nanoarchaeota archaeon]|nr:hypothetical protein [Nanoarchaeota archaeon]
MKAKEFLTTKLIIYAILIFLLLIFWSGLSILIRVIAIGYLIYALICLISNGFACINCWIKTIIAILIVLLAFIVTSKLFLVLIILLLIVDLIYDYMENSKK